MAVLNVATLVLQLAYCKSYSCIFGTSFLYCTGKCGAHFALTNSVLHFLFCFFTHTVSTRKHANAELTKTLNINNIKKKS